MASADWEKRQAFAKEYAISGNGTQSAISAGVPASSAHAVAYKWLRNPDIIVLIRKEIDSRMRGLAPVAVEVIHAIMIDPKTPANTRLNAARDILDRLGWVSPKKSSISIRDETNDLTKLTIEELTAIALGHHHS